MVTISNTGKICYYVKESPVALHNIDVSTGTVTGTDPNKTNDAADTTVVLSALNTGTFVFCLNSSNDGKYILFYGEGISGWPRETFWFGIN